MTRREALPESFLGVDAGGSRTRALVATVNGQQGSGEAGPANWTTLDPERCVAEIGAAIAEACRVANVARSSVRNACVALAGYYPPWHKEAVHEALAPQLTGASLRVTTDLEAAWAGALGGSPGIVL